ncbi:acyl-CoA dehydrogenase family protein [Amycolatopsis anabasis]|uniref:acyl-CoA dehydrogenase family protein n=1 Tax=Amycolatopsis anabasis TaxID=1840409 RepID=UPI001FE8F039|nr:acyl-CoA dehydrogenase family protein [Amycolatopsis anabasis]
MDTVHKPATTELVDRAAKLVPLLREKAAWAEENRRLPDETIEALAEAGIFRMRVPARYGGYESDARTMLAVAAELGRGDGSASWTASVWWITTWMAGLFPDEVQDEVFSTPDVRVCGTLSPSATAVPADGGLLLNGKWGFISGALHSHWQVVIAMSPTPDGAQQPIMGLVPMSDLRIVDDWHTAGLSGTGSVTTVAEDVLIPYPRVLPLAAVLREQYGSRLNATAPIFRAPLLPTASTSSVGTVIGLARAARELFLQRLPERRITYTDYSSQREAPLTHLQVAEATLSLDAAEFHAHRLATLVDTKGAGDEPWTAEERARARADMGQVCRLGKQAVDILNTASGGSSIYRTVPIQRIERDVQTINLHALMHPNTNLELFGRVLCGLEPNTLYF